MGNVGLRLPGLLMLAVTIIVIWIVYGQCKTSRDYLHSPGCVTAAATDNALSPCTTETMVVAHDVRPTYTRYGRSSGVSEIDLFTSRGGQVNVDVDDQGGTFEADQGDKVQAKVWRGMVTEVDGAPTANHPGALAPLIILESLAAAVLGVFAVVVLYQAFKSDSRNV
jgi:hypothetical protein